MHAPQGSLPFLELCVLVLSRYRSNIINESDRLIFIAIISCTDSCRVAAIVLTTWTYDWEIFSGVSTYAGDLVCTFLDVSTNWGSVPKS